MAENLVNFTYVPPKARLCRYTRQHHLIHFKLKSQQN